MKYRNVLRAKIDRFNLDQEFCVELKRDLTIDGYPTGISTVKASIGNDELLNVTLDDDAADLLDTILVVGLRTIAEKRKG